jgi:hypothetical protein
MRYLRELTTAFVTSSLCVIALTSQESRATTIDFEGFSDGTDLTTQYSGLTFSNAIILTAGISLNEFEFPPHSGVNVVSDNGGPITIDFSTPIMDFSGYFTYLAPLTIDAFDSSSGLVDSAVSMFSNNLALSGDPGSSPNELISVSSTEGISSITITGDSDGGSFVLDDASYSGTGKPVAMPEANDWLVLLPACITLIMLGRRQIHFLILSRNSGRTTSL